jgi:tetratricopeptide (TPR) repeat protein
MVVTRVLARAREEARRRRPIWGLGWLRIAAPACVMVALGGLLLHHMRGDLFYKDVPVSRGLEKHQPLLSKPARESQAKTPLAPAPWTGKAPAAAAKPVLPAEKASNQKEERAGASRNLASISQDTGLADKITPVEPQISRKGKPRRLAPAVEKGAEPEGDEIAYPGRGLDGAAAAKAPPAAKRSSPSISVMLDEAERALEAGQYQQANQAFSRALQSLPVGHPDRARALLGQARSCEGLGELDMAKRAYQALAHESRDYRDLAQRKIEELARP